MSSSTSLLPKPVKKDDHPIFLRVCHSPWVRVGQKALVSLRGLTAVYLLVSGIMIVNYEVKRNDRGWLAAFEFSNIVYFLQTLYQWMAFIWTFMHLHYPHHSSQSSAASRFQKMFSPPRQNSTTKNRTWFSIFYTAAVTFPHVVTLIYWGVEIPKKEADIPLDQIFGHGWFREFFVFSKFVVSSIIALIEVIFFSSIRRQDPVSAHILGLTILSLLYVAWAYLGKYLTGTYSYFFLDPEKIGWEYVTVAIIAFAASADIFFAVVYGITGVREKVTKKVESKSSGYTRLPQ